MAADRDARQPDGRLTAPFSRRVLLAGALAAGCAGGPRAEGDPARPFALPALPPEAPLDALGGLVLRDAAIGFGGLSGLHLDDDLRLTAISDLGHWLTARLLLEDGRPVGLAEIRTGPLSDGSGRPLGRGHAGDAEALARLPGGGWLVGFERWHRIRAYERIDGPGTYVEAPPGLDQAPVNGGLESLAVLADGRWLAIAEKLAPPEDPARRRAWLGGPGAWQAASYRPAAGFDPVDAAPLPDGGALVLERRFSVFTGFEGRLVRLPAAGLAAGGALSGEALLRLAPPLPTENYEGVAVVRAGGRTLVALISDDNDNPLQRTLLLLFALR